MAITTVGMALEFAGELEDQLESVYQQIIDTDDNSRIREQVLSLLKATHKRKIALKRLYDDNVYSDMDTGVLAPIASMQNEDYAMPDSPPKIAIENIMSDEMAVYENTLVMFYRDLSHRLRSGPRPILRRVEKMVKEIREIHRIS